MAIIESKQHWHRRATDQQETLDRLGPPAVDGRDASRRIRRRAGL